MIFWDSARDIIQQFDQENVLDQFKNYHDICIETEETIRMRRIMKWMIGHSVPILIIGPTGIGKTLIINRELAEKKPEECLIIKMNFTARLTSQNVLDNFMNRVDKKKRGTFGPKLYGQKGIWFIDDLNLPAPDTYGFQAPLELLRQYVEFGGWYEMEEHKMINIVDFSLVCSIAPPGGARTTIPNRLMRYFYVYSSIENSPTLMIRIFSKIVRWICLKNNLNEDSQRVLGFGVEGSIELFHQLSDSLKPTPAKPHYLFNLRDISKVFQGINMIEPKEFSKGANKITRMWLHETCRVMMDKITHTKDKIIFFNKLKSIMGPKLRNNIDTVLMEITPKSQKLEDSYVELERIIFTDILGEAAEVSEREILEQSDLNLIRKKVEMELEEFNVTKKESMSISIFDFAVLQILKICRILKMDKSHGVLIGLGGSGRQTLTKLSSYIMGQQMVTLEVHKNYTQEMWRQDIKKVLADASLMSKCSCLTITESQSNSPHLMQDIDSMLNLGEIPNLYDPEEFVKFLDRLKEKARREGEDKLVASGSVPE